MTHKWALLVLVGLGLGCSDMKMHEGKDEEDNETKVAIADVPAPVRDTLTKESGGATIASVDKEMGKHGVCYEADAMMNGKNYEIKVMPDGTLISKKLDPEDDEKGHEDKDHDGADHKD